MSYQEQRIAILKEVEPEVKRFMKKLSIAKASLEKGGYQNHDYSAVKRAALDLKRELTKLTQDTEYIYNK